jgi:hypothetical protein
MRPKAVGSFLIPWVFFLGERVINKHLWKLFYRGLNVSGDWVGYETVSSSPEPARTSARHWRSFSMLAAKPISCSWRVRLRRLRSRSGMPCCAEST